MPSGIQFICRRSTGTTGNVCLKSPAQQYHQAAKDVVISPKILQCEVKCFNLLSGNLRRMCVRPPSRRVAAIPDDANAKAMSHLDRIVAKINEMTNVFPVPPGASRKNRPPVLLSTACINVSICFAVHSGNGNIF
ncbi:hypothetical protein EVAR_64313_1 [Eumeta japonica]|uniref:Uncharacterized protein n=1 Tax=Eumeta variegata TaxID=151549 RepID=A0A4C2A4H6_EUMVA|nr:hypothetical protein EVAR_64313_1 [Eumeta japonica]